MARSNASEQQLGLWPRVQRNLGRADYDAIRAYWLTRIWPAPCPVWLGRLCLTYGEARLKAAIDRSVELALETRDRGERITGELLIRFCMDALHQQAEEIRRQQAMRKRPPRAELQVNRSSRSAAGARFAAMPHVGGIQ